MDVRIAKTSFNREVLKSCDSVKEAQERFPSQDKETVKRAYKEANPKGSKKKSKASED